MITAAPAGGTVIDFERFSSSRQLTSTPLDVGNAGGPAVTLIDNGDNRLGPMGHGLGRNGTWFRRGVLNNTPVTGWFQFNFVDGPVSFVGGFMNYASDRFEDYGPSLIQALGAGGTVLEGHDLISDAPISTGTSSIDAGAFRGIERASADIHAFRVSSAFSVLDDLTFGTVASPPVAVPEPAAALLLGAGLFGLGMARRRPR